MFHSRKTYLIVFTCLFFQLQAWSDGQSAKPTAPREQLRVLPEMARVRQSPGVDSIILGLAAGGLLVEPIEKTGDWYRVHLPNPEVSEGWIRADLLKPDPMTPPPQLPIEPVLRETALAVESALEPAAGQPLVLGAEPSEKTDAVGLSRPATPNTGATFVGPYSTYLLLLILGWTLFVSFSSLSLAILLPKDSGVDAPARSEPRMS